MGAFAQTMGKILVAYTDLGENRLKAPVAMVRTAAMIFKISSMSASFVIAE